MQIHINKDGQPYGPYTVDQLREYVQQGHFTEQDYACYDGQNWVTVAQVPGYAGGPEAQPQQPQQDVQAKAQASAQQAQAAAHQQVQVAQAQAMAAAATATAAKKKKIILFSSIGGVAACLIVGLLIWAPWSGGDDDSGGDVAGADTDGDDSEKDKDDGGSENGNSQPASSGNSSESLSLLDRVPSNAMALARLDLKQLLDKSKSSSQAKSMLENMVPPPFKGAFDDLASVGIDLSEPVLAYFLRSPVKADEEPLFGISFKVSDPKKLKGFMAANDAPSPKESRDGYDLWELVRDKAYLVIEDDILIFVGCDDRRVRETKHVINELERFLKADGSDSFAKSHDLSALDAKKYDAGVFVSADNLASVADGQELPPELLEFAEAGSFIGGLRFDAGEVVLEFSGKAKNFPDLGGGGISSALTKFLSADALANLSMSFNLKSLAELAETMIESLDGPGLDDPVPNMNFKPREVLDVFQGGFAFSITKFSGFSDESFGDEAAIEEPPNGDFGAPGDPGAEADPFARPSGSAEAKAVTDEENPFGAPAKKPAVEAPPFALPSGSSNDFPGGFPDRPGAPAGGPSDMTVDMPLQFVLAASIDAAKFQALLSNHPPVAGVMALAALAGVTIQPTEGALVVSTSDNKDVAAAGGFSSPVSSSTASIFKEHDFVVQVSSESILKMVKEEVKGPEAMLIAGALTKFDGLAITADSGKGEGTFSLRLGMTDKKTNSLAAILELAAPFAAMLGSIYDRDLAENHRTLAMRNLKTVYEALLAETRFFPMSEDVGSVEEFVVWWRNQTKDTRPELWFIGEDEKVKDLAEDEEGPGIPPNIPDDDADFDADQVKAIGYCVALPGENAETRSFCDSLESGSFPLMWSRGLDAGDDTWDQGGAWGGEGGLVLFSNGTVSWHDDTKGNDGAGVFTTAINKKDGADKKAEPTSDIKAALPEGWDIYKPE